ncbi:hypothetical protein [Ereboglobus luteus]|nr:hypothetical protein [Ereboglobus luteus]
MPKNSKHITKQLYDEILRRFPEIHHYVTDGDEELPYSMVGYIARWLKDLGPKAISPNIIKRLQDFTHWCESLPFGQTAEDDIDTILMVALYEELFDMNHTRALLPKLMHKEEFVLNADYLKNWVGEDNYNAALKYF